MKHEARRFEKARLINCIAEIRSSVLNTHRIPSHVMDYDAVGVMLWKNGLVELLSECEKKHDHDSLYDLAETVSWLEYRREKLLGF